MATHIAKYLVGRRSFGSSFCEPAGSERSKEGLYGMRMIKNKGDVRLVLPKMATSRAAEEGGG